MGFSKFHENFVKSCASGKTFKTISRPFKRGVIGDLGMPLERSESAIGGIREGGIFKKTHDFFVKSSAFRKNFKTVSQPFKRGVIGDLSMPLERSKSAIGGIREGGIFQIP